MTTATAAGDRERDRGEDVGPDDDDVHTGSSQWWGKGKR